METKGTRLTKPGAPGGVATNNITFKQALPSTSWGRPVAWKRVAVRSSPPPSFPTPLNYFSHPNGGGFMYQNHFNAQAHSFWLRQLGSNARPLGVAPSVEGVC